MLKKAVFILAVLGFAGFISIVGIGFVAIATGHGDEQVPVWIGWLTAVSGVLFVPGMLYGLGWVVKDMWREFF